jgi:hypothetical protein
MYITTKDSKDKEIIENLLRYLEHDKSCAIKNKLECNCGLKEELENLCEMLNIDIRFKNDSFLQ